MYGKFRFLAIFSREVQMIASKGSADRERKCSQERNVLLGGGMLITSRSRQFDC